MAFLKRDVNLGFLFLLIATLLLFLGFTIYYETHLKNVQSEYDTKLSQLEKVTEELNSEKSRLNQTYKLRVKAEQDIEALDDQFKEISEERDNLEGERDTLSTELLLSKNQLAKAKADLKQNEVLLAQTQDSLAVANQKARKLEIKVDNLEDDLEDCEAQLGES